MNEHTVIVGQAGKLMNFELCHIFAV
jgi:hypothetical protein